MIINSRNELPVYDHRLAARPSELLTGPIQPVGHWRRGLENQHRSDVALEES